MPLNETHNKAFFLLKGSEGYVVVGLSAAVHPTSFTLEHIPKSLALYNNISSAPKDFTVYGLDTPTDTEGNLLGVYRYRWALFAF